MTKRQHIAGATLTAILLTLASGTAYGDPAPVPGDPGFVHFTTTSHVVTEGGTDLHLPPGYFISVPQYSALDAEMKRLQDQETRLKTENQSLRGSMAGWQPGWYVLGAALATGLVGGWYIHSKL